MADGLGPSLQWHVFAQPSADAVAWLTALEGGLREGSLRKVIFVTVCAPGLRHLAVVPRCDVSILKSTHAPGRLQV